LGGLFTLNWLLDNFLSSIILVIVVIFQADIRRALAHMGRNPFFAGNPFVKEDQAIEELVKGCVSLAARRIGALVVIERETGINDFLEVGTELDARLSGNLLCAVFQPQSPIHDGAAIVQRGRLTRAGCFLPLTQNPNVSPRLGTRHRAAIGLTELVDAVVIVVSEETGKVSVVISGKMTRDLDPITLRKVLGRLLEPHRAAAGKR
jgi:uncharacterized protein (TIGR00159 family)